MDINFWFKLSDQVIREAFVKKGEVLPSRYVKIVNLAQISNDFREVYHEFYGDKGYWDYKGRPLETAEVQLETFEFDPSQYPSRRRVEPIEFDQLDPSVEELEAAFIHMAASKGVCDDSIRNFKAQEAERQAAESAARARQHESYLQAQAEADKAAQEAARKRDEEKQAWVDEFGSEFLKKARSAGYDCQRDYVKERVVQELPGFIVDFDGQWDWDDRSSPKEYALDESLDLIKQGYEAKVVWITKAPDYKDTQREAIAISNYLGKYYIVKPM